jgi:hypothetical protein
MPEYFHDAFAGVSCSIIEINLDQELRKQFEKG